jgi:hypothetical protein
MKNVKYDGIKYCIFLVYFKLSYNIIEYILLEMDMKFC